MAAEAVPKNELMHHFHFSTTYQEDEMMEKCGLEKRSTWTNCSLSALKNKVAKSVYINWSELVSLRLRASFANYLVDQQGEKTYYCCLFGGILIVRKTLHIPCIYPLARSHLIPYIYGLWDILTFLTIILCMYPIYPCHIDHIY